MNNQSIDSNLIEITDFSHGLRFDVSLELKSAPLQEATQAIQLGTGLFGDAYSAMRFTLREINGAGHFQCWRADRMLAEFLVSPVGPNEAAWEFFVAYFQQLLQQRIVVTEVPGVVGPSVNPWAAIIFRPCLAPAVLPEIFAATLTLAEAYVRLRKRPFGANSRN